MQSDLIPDLAGRARLGFMHHKDSADTHPHEQTITLFLIHCCRTSHAAIQVVDCHHGSGVLKLGAVSLLNANAIVCLDTAIKFKKKNIFINSKQATV